MHFIVYLSSAKKLYSDQDLEAILTVSRRQNAIKDITGILLYHDGSIMQVIEGEAVSVNNLYARLLTDDRHHQIIQVMTGNSNERYFGEWSMAFSQITNIQWKEVSGYLNPQDISKVGNLKEISTIINSFVKTNFHRQ
jgi:hypothetical protein